MPAAAKKARFSVRNWSEYNESLVARGSITLWFSEEAMEAWYHENGTGKRGRPFRYSDSTIELFLSIRELLRLPYRQTEGFVRGLLTLVHDELDVPDFTSTSSRVKPPSPPPLRRVSLVPSVSVPASSLSASRKGNA